MADDQHGLMVLLPDLVRNEPAWLGLVDRLRPLRPEVVAVTATRLRPDQYGALYAGSVVKQHNRGRANAPWLGQQLASLDMSIPVVLRTSLPVDLSALLTEWKGPSGYGTRNRGDLREVSAASDRCVSLFHTSDSTAEMRKDAAVFFGAELVDEILSGRRSRPVPLEAVLALRCFVPVDDEPHPYDLPLRCLVRGMALIAFDARIEISGWGVDGQVATAVELRRQLASLRGRAVLEELPATLEAMAAVLPPVEIPITGATTLVHRRKALLDVLQVTCRMAAWGPELAAQLIHELEANELFVDPWERHRITTAMTFYSHNAR